MSILTALIRSASVCRFVVLGALLSGSPGLVAKEVTPAESEAGGGLEDVTKLPLYEVKGARPEEFGFRITGRLAIPGPSYVMIREVFPNTAAAKAGLRPGDVISKIDGKSTSFFSGALKLNRMQQLQWTGPEGGKKRVTLSLEVHAPGAADVRTVTMVMPAPAPRWGGEKWSAPEGRPAAVVPEAGPLAALAREVMDNGIWSVLQEESFLGAAPRFEAPVLGYEWRLVQPSGAHRIWVTQQRGKTEITLEHRSGDAGYGLFLSSPSGAMGKAWCWPAGKKEKGYEIPPEDVRARFEAEVDFWLTKVGRVTGRWPFEVLAGETAGVAGSSEARRETTKVSAPPARAFLKLPVATAAQKELFLDALGKVGLDAEGWAYTETSRSPGDDHVTTVRFDPSEAPERSSSLVKVDGKVPKAAYLQQWHNEGRGALPGLGELPPLASVVDVDDVRVYADETAAVVFELPVKASNAEFPADKFQARFRVNKTYRSFEDFSVKLREPMRVAGIAKVTDAGLEARFQTLDPGLAPQPVWLKMGGGVSVLFMKVTRAFEVTRTDFKRVVPFENPDMPGEKNL